MISICERPLDTRQVEIVILLVAAFVCALIIRDCSFKVHRTTNEEDLKELRIAEAYAEAENVKSVGLKPAFGLSDALLLAGLPGVAIATVALFQAGYLSYFGVPLSTVSLDVASIFEVLGGMFRVAATDWPAGPILFLSIASIGIPVIPGMVPKSRTDRTLRRIPGTLIAVSVVSFFLTPFLWASFHVPLVAAFYVITAFMTPATYRVPPNAIHIEKWFSLGIFRVIICGLLIVPSAFLAGYKLAEGGQPCAGGREVAAVTEAGKKKFYLVASLKPDRALGIEITPGKDDSKPMSAPWAFGAPDKVGLNVVTFDHALSGGIRVCDTIGPIETTGRQWIRYQAMGVTAKLRMDCDEQDIPETLSRTELTSAEDARKK